MAKQMLVLTRRRGQKLFVGDDITITVVEVCVSCASISAPQTSELKAEYEAIEIDEWLGAVCQVRLASLGNGQT